MKNVHEEGQDYDEDAEDLKDLTCTDCSFVAKSKSNLREHRKARHLKIRDHW